MDSKLITIVLLSFTLPTLIQSQDIDPNCISETHQQITFYQSRGEQEKFQTFCSNIPDIQATPGVARTAKYFCVDRGVWIIQATYNGVPTKEGILVSGNIGWICLFLPEEWNTAWNSVRYLAAANMTTSSLSLYRARYREEEFQLDGNEVRLPAVVPISSFALTGSQGFTVYEGLNFDGESACVTPGPNDPFLSGVSFLPELGVRNVGSVRRGGCESKELVGKRFMPGTLEGDAEILSRIRIERA